ncbi:hypothetical protein AB1Y20_015087 [Prymnesium parvum]|uniref:Uncharacterized protein n=1 Tax=Prymnesium parvum TaxID=97485 RepID=A0AB34K1I0_PRYPA
MRRSEYVYAAPSATGAGLSRAPGLGAVRKKRRALRMRHLIQILKSVCRAFPFFNVTVVQRASELAAAIYLDDTEGLREAHFGARSFLLDSSSDSGDALLQHSLAALNESLCVDFTQAPVTESKGRSADLE